MCKQYMLLLMSPGLPQNSSFLAIRETFHVLLPVLRNNTQAVRLTDLNIQLQFCHALQARTILAQQCLQ